MIAAVVNPPVWIEMPAIIAGALAGALFAQKRGLDIIGILALALVSGLGGGMMRDILLARVPVALTQPRYLWTVAAAAGVGAFFAHAANRLKFAMQMVDAVSLGLFSVIGAQSAVLADLPNSSAVLLGTITGIGGGLLRDVLVGDVPPRTLRRGAPYASAAFLGASLYLGLVVGLDVRKVVAQVAAVLLVCLIRGVAVWRGWETSGPKDRTPAFLRTDRPDPASVSEPHPTDAGTGSG
jgi:uncharacterized membrane protein YeiH